MDYLLPAAQSEHLTPLKMLKILRKMLRKRPAYCDAWYLDWRWNVQIQLLLNLHGKLFHYLPKYKCQKSLNSNIMKDENWTIFNFDFSMAACSLSFKNCLSQFYTIFIKTPSYAIMKPNHENCSCWLYECLNIFLGMLNNMQKWTIFFIFI